MIHVTSYGAAQGVTGSCHLLKIGSIRILVDCGLFQGEGSDEKNYEPFAFDVKKINYLILTHGHLDHIGRVAKLVKEGFNGTIIATKPTKEIAKIMLLDSAKILKEEYKTLKRKARRRGDEESVQEPLYSEGDVHNVFTKNWHTLEYFAEFKLKQHIVVTLANAGHILGSAFAMIDAQDEGKHKRIVFSGDLGSPNRLIIDNPDKLERANILYVESTYGDRVHKPLEQSIEEFKKAVQITLKRNGNVIIPSFALERTQEILWLLHEMHDNGELPKCRVFLDSPLAIKATELYNKYPIHLSDELEYYKGGDHNPFSFKWLETTPKSDQSMAINSVKKRSIIIAGSGMCSGGRIMHHLKHRLWNPKNSIVFVGFQVEGTLGRSIIDGAKFVKIYSEEIIVKAQVFTINGFSAHADQSELLDWIGGVKGLDTLCLVHGEVDNMEIFAKVIQERFGYEALIVEPKVTLAL
ncbi:MAG: MBL fold metallo-hydrolase [Sulfurimonas sp.]|nr:MBL fold metallo-hydrolase [Sulfurimonas sp.]